MWLLEVRFICLVYSFWSKLWRNIINFHLGPFTLIGDAFESLQNQKSGKNTAKISIWMLQVGFLIISPILLHQNPLGIAKVLNWDYLNWPVVILRLHGTKNEIKMLSNITVTLMSSFKRLYFLAERLTLQCFFNSRNLTMVRVG